MTHAEMFEGYAFTAAQAAKKGTAALLAAATAFTAAQAAKKSYVDIFSAYASFTAAQAAKKPEPPRCAPLPFLHCRPGS